jgi:RNA polymerase sigma-70 factor, ECF subfamily
MSNRDEKQLMEDFLAGDKDAFNQIIENYHVRVYRLAYKFTHNRKDAEDVTQDTFLRAYENLIKYPKEVNLKPWLMTICVNLCRNLAKKKKSFNFADLEKAEDDDRSFVDSVKDKEMGVEKKVRKKEEAKWVQKAVVKLKPKYQVVIRLRYIEDLSYQEIAETLGIPMNTVKVHLNRAKKQLKQHLSYG